MTYTFTAQQNQPIYENKQYHDLPSDMRNVVDFVVAWVHQNGVVTTYYNEDTSSLDVVFMFTEETYQSFISYADSIMGDHKTWLSNYATVQSSIGFNFTNKIEIVEG